MRACQVGSREHLPTDLSSLVGGLVSDLERAAPETAGSASRSCSPLGAPVPDLLTSLERRWEVFATSPRGRRTYVRWQATEPDLAVVPTLDALTSAARDIGGADLERRDTLHRALLHLGVADQDARCAVLHLLHPALVTTARIYSDTWSHDEVASIVVTAALDEMVRCPTDAPRPAARIIRSVRRTVWKEAQRQRTRESALAHTTALDEVEGMTVMPERPAADLVLELVHEAVRDGVLDRTQARLVVLHRVLSVPTAVIAAREGYPPSTIRQRRSRAESALARLAIHRVA